MTRTFNGVGLLVCAWHEPHQRFLFTATHGICANCREKVESIELKHNAPEWVKLLIDGKWATLPGSGYWPEYRRVEGDTVQRITYCASLCAWELVSFNPVKSVEPLKEYGFLDDLLRIGDEVL